MIKSWVLPNLLTVAFCPQPGKHCSQPASPQPLAASRADGLHSPKELRISSLVVRGQELQKSADYPLPDKTFPVFQKLLAKALLTESASQGVGRT